MKKLIASTATFTIAMTVVFSLTTNTTFASAQRSVTDQTEVATPASIWTWWWE